MKKFNKQLGITFINAFLIVTLTTGMALASVVLIAGLGITTHFWLV